MLFLYLIFNIDLFSFTKRERVKELIRLLTEEPEVNCSHERGHKFPFLASQVFSDGGEGIGHIARAFFYRKEKFA